MTTIVIKPKTKSETELLARILKKLNVELQVVEEQSPNYQTRKAMDYVNNKKGNKFKDSKELFNNLGI